MASGLHISINAEKVFDVASVPITNSILTTWVVSIIIFAVCAKIYTHFSKVKTSQKPSRFQSLIEMIIESLFNLVQGIAGDNKKARIFFPLISTFFLFILLSNWSGLIPGVGTIGFREAEKVAAHSEEVALVETHEEAVPVEVEENSHATKEEKAIEEDSHETSTEESVATIAAVEASHEGGSGEHGTFVPYFRGPTADLNTTLALAVFAMVSVQIAGFKFLGFHYPSKFFNFKSPIEFFVGILELSSEFSKVISFAFRLFGNIFAGEVLLTVMAFLMPLFGPIPFLGLEVFVGLVQALVFSMLALVFMNLATMGHGESH
jgi:F-type H+-transporting ATPase subunit a